MICQKSGQMLSVATDAQFCGLRLEVCGKTGRSYKPMLRLLSSLRRLLAVVNWSSREPDPERDALYKLPAGV